MEKEKSTKNSNWLPELPISDTLPPFIEEKDGLEREALTICWYRLHQYQPQHLQEWVDSITSPVYREKVKYHLQRCTAWLWLCNFNQQFIETQIRFLPMREQQQMRRQLNELVPIYRQWRREQEPKHETSQ